MQRRILLTVDHGTTNSRDTARALVAEFGAGSAQSVTATATSTTTSIGIGRLPLPGAAPESPVFWNLIIVIIFNPFVHMGPLLSPFMRR